MKPTLNQKDKLQEKSEKISEVEVKIENEVELKSCKL